MSRRSTRPGPVAAGNGPFAFTLQADLPELLVRSGFES